MTALHERNAASVSAPSPLALIDRAAEDNRLARLTTLLEVARMLTSELDPSEIVRQVLVRAIAVIPAAGAGTLYLEDPATGRLAVKDSVGFGPSIFKLSLKLGEGAAGRAALGRKGAIYADREAVLAAVSDASPETFRHFQEASDGPMAPHAAMAAPLIFKGTILGALVVDAFQGKGTFTGEDLEILEHFAQIAAVAIVNARLYESEHAHRVRLEVLNNEITRQRDELGQRLSALDAMAQLARQELGLNALASRLATLTSARAYILDGLARIRAVEPTATGAEQCRDLLDSDDCAALLHRVAADYQPRSAIVGTKHIAVSPIVGGAELLGYVVVEATEPSAPSVNMALSEMAALITASVFVRERALEEGVVRGRVDLLGRLLDGNVPRSSRSFESLPPPLRLAVGKIRQGKGKAASPADCNLLREVCSLAQQVLNTQSVPGVAAVRGDCIVLAWSAGQRDQRSNPRSKLEEIAASVEQSAGLQIRFALTEIVKEPLLVPQLFQEARLAAELRPWSEGAVVDAGGLGAYRLIIGAVSSGQAIEFSERTLAKVISHDRRHNGCLIETLRTYLAQGASLSLTAKAMDVHVHTVRYRLTKMEELTGLGLQSTEDRLTLELAFRILDLAGLADTAK